MAWGVWQLPESELHVLGDVREKDVLELGCGAAQWSIALHALGARVTGLDNSSVQLEHARALMAQTGTEFPLVHASAETTPFADASFDVIFCDHGAMAFADPSRTVPEAARLLRAGGLLASTLRGRRTPSIRASGSSSTTGTFTPSKPPANRSDSSSPTAAGSHSFARTASWSRT
jgi:ubiquinone/menaquinone biosynthesis C-methylase UbiE